MPARIDGGELSGRTLLLLGLVDCVSLVQPSCTDYGVQKALPCTVIGCEC